MSPENLLITENSDINYIMITHKLAKLIIWKPVGMLLICTDTNVTC